MPALEAVEESVEKESQLLTVFFRFQNRGRHLLIQKDPAQNLIRSEFADALHA